MGSARYKQILRDDHFCCVHPQEFLTITLSMKCMMTSIIRSLCKRQWGRKHQNRMLGNISMFAPTYSLTRHLPGWLSTMPQLLVRALYDQMSAQPQLTLTNYAGIKLDVGTLLRCRYGYQTLTSSRPHVADGDFAFETEISFSDARVDRGLHQQHFGCDYHQPFIRRQSLSKTWRCHAFWSY